MKVVVDEGVPRALVKALRDIGIDAYRFPHEWRGLTNGKLIAVAEKAGFDRLLTNDRNMANQTNLGGRLIGVIALPSNRAAVILHRANDIADTLMRSVAGQHVIVNMDGSRIARTLLDGAPEESGLPPITSFRPRG
ncbi:MAG: hypothetical protein ACRC7C_11280 [Beijerinckiaceae bacterium]